MGAALFARVLGAVTGVSLRTWLYVALGAAVIGGVLAFALYWRGVGYDAKTVEIERQDQGAVNAAQKAIRNSRECNATDGMWWDTTAGECRKW